MFQKEIHLVLDVDYQVDVQDVLDVQDVQDVDYQVDALDSERKQITESLITGRRHLQFAREMGSHRVTHMHTYTHKHKYTCLHFRFH